MKSNYILFSLMLLLTLGCDEDDKVTLDELYQSNVFSVNSPLIIVDNIQTIADVIPIPNTNNLMLLGNDDEQNMFTCQLMPNLIAGPLTTYGGFQQDFSNRFISDLSENIFILGGTRSNTIGQNDFNLVKINFDGEEIWNTTYGTANCDPLTGGILDSQGRIIMTGATANLEGPNCSFLDGLLIVTDNDGNTIESIRHDFDSNINIIENLVELSSGNYGIIHTSSTMSHEDDRILFSVSNNLTDLTSFTELGKSTPILGKTKILAYENGFIICTTILTGNQTDILIQKISSEGELQERILIESGCNESFRDCSILSDGSIIVLGSISENRNDPNVLIGKVSFIDGVQWCNQYDLGTLDSGQKLVRFEDDELVVFAGTGTRGSSSIDVFAFVISSTSGEVTSE